jgi:small GTP-binding protein
VSSPTRKICLLGDAAVGKTALVRRFAYGTFEAEYTPSTGRTVSSKTVVVARQGAPQAVTVTLWDPASSDRRAALDIGFLAGADAVLLVADAGRAHTVDRCFAYVASVQKALPQVPLVVALNKMDEDCPTDPALEQARALAALLKTALWLTSARDNREVDALFRALVTLTDAP